MTKKRVVVTGLGFVASNGVGVDAFWRANKEGRSGITPLDAFDTQDFASRIGGQVRGFDPTDQNLAAAVRSAEAIGSILNQGDSAAR